MSTTGPSEKFRAEFGELWTVSAHDAQVLLNLARRVLDVTNEHTHDDAEHKLRVMAQETLDVHAEGELFRPLDPGAVARR